jgi:MFS family permease
MAVEESKENADQSSESRPVPPRGGFLKGAIFALLIVLPGQSTLLRLLATDPLALQLSAKAMLVTIAIFAGLPAMIVFGSIGSRLARSTHLGSRARILRGALLGAAASLGIVVLAALPTAAFPHSMQSGLLTLLGSLLIGGLAGGLLGGWLARDSVIS